MANRKVNEQEKGRTFGFYLPSPMIKAIRERAENLGVSQARLIIAALEIAYPTIFDDVEKTKYIKRFI